MDTGSLVFAQLMAFLPRHDFNACPSLRRRPPAAGILLPRSVSPPRLRPTHLPRKPPRHRNVPPRRPAQALSRRLPRCHRPQHFGRRQSCSRLADLCRLRDLTIVLAGVSTSQLYPIPLRRVAVYDVERRRLVFLTNNFDLPAGTIAQLYQCRW